MTLRATLALALLCGLAPRALSAASEAEVRAALTAAGWDGASAVMPARPLPACNHPVTAAPRGAGGPQAELRCDAPAWTRRVRMAGAAAAVPRPTPAAPQSQGRWMAVTVAPLARGQIIGPGDVVLAPMAQQVGPDSFDAAAPLVGRRVRQALGKGQPFLARNLERAYAVRAGHPAKLRLDTAGVSVEVLMMPMEDGEAGQMIRVRHPASGRILRARVTGEDFLSLAPNTG
ncbi:MAG: flagellar basal body P-ring formation chaperone FlgA [Gemmobacter sp.]|nr:flagellar basal body P-ring formation chaperone FlgA [Gemmobacter sp.]